MWFGLTSPEQLACLTRLRSLGSLELWVAADAAPAMRSLTVLQRLTHLALGGERLDELLTAVGQLTGLVSLELWGFIDGVPLQPLAVLQQLTSLHLVNCTMDEQRVLAGLGQMRRLVTDFDSPAAAVAAGLARLEECKIDFNKGGEREDNAEEEELLGGALIQAPGQLRTYPLCLAGFDLSSVHTLQLGIFEVGDDDEAEEEVKKLCQALSRCPQLRALRLEQVPCQPEALQAIVALPQLQHLCMSDFDQQMDCGRLTVLACCSRQLRQLTLWGMAYLPESTLLALMVGLPQLRLLRLLGCSADLSEELSQERCQALVGQLQLYELQVDVVVKDGSGRARWMMARLLERWREA
jgi:hypothetical protein